MFTKTSHTITTSTVAPIGKLTGALRSDVDASSVNYDINEPMQPQPGDLI